VRSDDYGYNRIKVHNATHLYFEYVSDNQDGKVLDSVWYIKEKHGPGLYTCHLGMNGHNEKARVKDFYNTLDDFNRKVKAKKLKKSSKRVSLMQLIRPAKPIKFDRL